MASTSLEPQLWESCRALIDESRRARAALQTKWDALLSDRERVGGLGITFLAEASARLAAHQDVARSIPELPG